VTWIEVPLAGLSKRLLELCMWLVSVCERLDRDPCLVNRIHSIFRYVILELDLR
jgi:hypothetical protein